MKESKIFGRSGSAYCSCTKDMVLATIGSNTVPADLRSASVRFGRISGWNWSKLKTLPTKRMNRIYWKYYVLYTNYAKLYNSYFPFPGFVLEEPCNAQSFS